MSPPDVEHLSPAELKGLVIALLARVAALERTVAAQRDEIARLKNVPGRPAIKPSGMENATQPKPPTDRGKGRKSGGKKTARRVIHEDRVIKAAAPCCASGPISACSCWGCPWSPRCLGSRSGFL